jgi:hypothetical protein
MMLGERMTDNRGTRKTSNAAERRPAKPLSKPIAVSEEQQRHLIEDVAYFHAERYRCVEPGQCREQDRREAEAEIESVLKHRRKR